MSQKKNNSDHPQGRATGKAFQVGESTGNMVSNEAGETGRDKKVHGEDL